MEALREENLWEDNYKDCPWYDQKMCVGQVSYNRSVNDPHYSPCLRLLCPIAFWIEIFSKGGTHE